MIDDQFFVGLQSVSPAEAAARCLAQQQAIRQRIAGLTDDLQRTARGDKQSAHEIRQSIAQFQALQRKLRPVAAHYRAKQEQKESHFLWVDGVRAVCGQETLQKVYEWMKTEKKRRKEAA